MQTILVTGGCGYIGAHTIVDLIENGFNVIALGKDKVVNGIYQLQDYQIR